MGPFRAVVLLASLCLVYMTGCSATTQCQAPNWDASAGPDPFPALRGKVVLVALLKGYCGYCARQAGKMFQMKNQLIREGYSDIEMIIINGGEPRSRNLVSNLINASPLRVIQDTEDHALYQRVFTAFKDDFLVYDRCNQAAIYIPHPYSDLRRSITKQVLKAVHEGRHDCYCSLDYPAQNPDDRMQGDDPGTRFYQTRNMRTNMLHCNATDAFCQRFQRAIAVHQSRRDLHSSRTEVGVRHELLRRILALMSREAARGAGLSTQRFDLRGASPATGPCWWCVGHERQSRRCRRCLRHHRRRFSRHVRRLPGNSNSL